MICRCCRCYKLLLLSVVGLGFLRPVNRTGRLDENVAAANDDDVMLKTMTTTTTTTTMMMTGDGDNADGSTNDSDAALLGMNRCIRRHPLSKTTPNSKQTKILLKALLTVGWIHAECRSPL